MLRTLTELLYLMCKIDGVGTHEELLENNSIYREVYNQQMNDNADFDKKGGEQ